MAPPRKRKKLVNQNVREKKILIEKDDIQYNISTRMHPEWHLHSDVTSRKIFTIIGAKEHLQRDRRRKRRGHTRRRKNLHKKNKERNRILTVPRKRGIFIRGITHGRTFSEGYKKG
ncbi:hypothetical protein C922_05613 [Plasmodium inui San Antonio 1]|uniref:Uncharacterized protein n=1 Tax=Plasmodium inui San Antonio 1 TaxID=1237626 RepID=W7A4J5_9APIC|nr:hypothetical protein C922_05613 [Plasmodium inui San Antonio 1]EUD64009.1 hypothetical protein C922_05613 [Plasmodium inui San Antonio 1]